jgi:hypothetical protein
MYYGSGSHLWAKVGFGATTYLTCPYGPRALNINKSLADLSVQLDTHVLNARAHIFKTPHVRAIMHM